MQDSLSWSTKDQAFVAKHGEKQENSKITSLSAGAITKSSTDAVTGWTALFTKSNACKIFWRWC
ncbi:MULTISPECIES: hypothetical protein [unclassified Bartonella]|uniref:hypothetical protein n=1 Tax=unclassified Bartonella TaxID=2645622 RepID=UPI0035CEE95D